VAYASLSGGKLGVPEPPPWQKPRKQAESPT
jgi:hypothetical protein